MKYNIIYLIITIVFQFSNNYIKTHYNGTYRSKIKIMYNREDDIVTNKVEMTYCQRLKPSVKNY